MAADIMDTGTAGKRSQAMRATEHGIARCKCWYLIYAKPRLERVAFDNLARQGYEAYLPLIEASRRRRGRYHGVIEPMFPRYLFIRLDAVTDNWGPIRSTLGVASIVRFGGLPARVPDALVAALRAHDGANGVQQRPVKAFGTGDRVRIIDGLLGGYEGVFEGRAGKDRVAVLLEIAGKATSVMLSAHDLQSA